MRRAIATLISGLLILSAVALTLSSARPPTAGPTPTVVPIIGAHYYPWYEWERWANQPATDTPKLGRYTSADRAVVAEHIRGAKRADLDFFMLSCLAPDGSEAKTLREAVLPELDLAQFPFALHYETPIALGLRPEKTIDFAAKLPDGITAGDRFIEQFDYLTEMYFRRGNYLRIDGKAVVMLYLGRQTWPRFSSSLGRTRRRGGRT